MDLRVGERSKNLSGDTVYVQQKLPRPGPTPVYNLEVQDEHVYYVGTNGVLAHNVGRNYDAASNLPQLKGSSENEIRKILSDSGFARTRVSNSIARNETWSHPDGSEVRIHPYGNENESIYRSANNAHVHKQDPFGNQLNDRGLISSVDADTHIGIRNPRNLPAVRRRPHGAGTR